MSNKQQQTIINEFKSSGEFDSLKNRILSENGFNDRLKDIIVELVTEKVNADNSLMAKNRGQMSALLEGSIVKNKEHVAKDENMDFEKIIKEKLQSDEFYHEVYNRMEKYYKE